MIFQDAGGGCSGCGWRVSRLWVAGAQDAGRTSWLMQAYVLSHAGVRPGLCRRASWLMQACVLAYAGVRLVPCRRTSWLMQAYVLAYAGVRPGLCMRASHTEKALQVNSKMSGS